MKKMLYACLLLSLLLSVMTLATAAEETRPQLEMSLDFPDLFQDALDFVECEDYLDGAGLHIGELDDHSYKYVYLKKYEYGASEEEVIPVDESYCIIEFEVEEAGTYEFLIEIMAFATGIPRTALVQVDDGQKYYINSHHGERHMITEYYTGVTEKLEAGTHTFTIYLAEDFDDQGIKSLFFDCFSFVRTADMDGNPVVTETESESASGKETETVRDTAAATEAASTAAATATAKPDATTVAEDEKGGCSAVVGGVIPALLLTGGTCLLLRKRD